MKKNYFIAILMLLVSSVTLTSVIAQVSGMPTGYITTTPVISTEETPVWYNMMASNTAAERKNRYMYYDGTDFKTELFNSPGITNELQNDKYLWRLEQGSTGAEYVIIVNKSTGKRLFAESTITTNGVVTLAENGIEWKMGAAADVATGTVPGQYYFNFMGWTDNRFLNAGDGVSMAWNVLVFNAAGSTSKSSGWFFYPVTATQTVTFDQPANGTIAITGTNGTPTPTELSTGNSVLVGTVVSVSVTPASGYVLESLTVNGSDVTAQVADNKYQFAVNADATVSATFIEDQGTGINDTKLNAVLSPNPFNEQLSINLNNKNIDEVEIFNIQGVKVYNSTQITKTINTSNFVSGYYFVKIYSGNETLIQKIVKLN